MCETAPIFCKYGISYEAERYLCPGTHACWTLWSLLAGSGHSLSNDNKYSSIVGNAELRSVLSAGAGQYAERCSGTLNGPEGNGQKSLAFKHLQILHATIGPRMGHMEWQDLR